MNRPFRSLSAFLLGSFVWILFSGGCSNRGAGASTPHPREKDQTLFLAVDGIPFSMAEDLHRKKEVSQFQTPSRVIATFPSTTTTGFTGLFRPLGAQSAPGYDARFFSYAKNEVRGNLLEAYDFEAADYNRFFNYKRSTGFQQVVMYTVPNYALRKDLKELKPLLWNHPEKDSFFFYVGSTDGTGHLDGSEATRKAFLEILKKVENLREAYRIDFRRDLRVVLFSDHGFHWAPLKKIDVNDFKDRLKTAGLQLEESLKSPKQVVVITWGNISGGDFYTSEEVAPDVAKVLLEMPGVDLVAYRQKDRIVVKAPRASEEEGEILFDGSKKRFGYRPLQGDPLHYQAVLEALKKEGKLDSKGLASEKDWFEKTQNHLYPDALYRLHDAFFGLVQNPATLLLSTKEDYEFGDNFTRFGTKLRGGMVGTHGALSLESSSAFLMTTDPAIKLAPVLRYDEALLSFQKFVGNSVQTPQAAPAAAGSR